MKSLLSNCISVAEARQLHENWGNTRGKHIEMNMGKPDGCEFIFSVDELQEFLDYVRANTQNHTPGIRVYLGAYGPEKQGKATVFFAPTLGTTADSENNYDLRPLNNGLQGVPPRFY